MQRRLKIIMKNIILSCRLIIFATSLLFWPLARAAIINVSPADAPVAAYTKIEAAVPGDEVVIAPGKYRFLLHLTGRGTVAQPIIIRAQDPANKPVWDFTGKTLDTMPGSYTAKDRNRGAWQVDGGTGYKISGIIFSNCHNSAKKNASGIRYLNGATNLYVKDCIFSLNDNGITGGTQDSSAAFEFCEFDRNGNPAAAKPTHNVYIYGGTFVLRYSYAHDSQQGQNFHVRAHHATLEYNWFARAASYEGDLMIDDDFVDAGNGPFTQTMLFRGNVLVQKAKPANVNKVIAVFNDNGVAKVTFNIRLVNNTYVGNGTAGQGGNAALVQLSNGDGSQMNAELVNNIISGTTATVSINNSSFATVTGRNNWLKTGVNPGALTDSIFSASPGFQNAANGDFTLAPGSAAINAADISPVDLPAAEYFQNEANARQFRSRATVKDIGAFESTTTGFSTGPYGRTVTTVQIGGEDIPVGQFNGLFYETNGVAQASSGFLTINVTTNLSYTGQLLLDGDTIPLAGATFPIVAQTVSRANWGKGDLTLDLGFQEPASSQQLTGSLSAAGWTAPILADRMVWG